MPYALGYWIGKRLVAVAAITGKRFAIRAIRVKIFWANSVYNSAIEKTEFVPPVLIEAALEQTVDCFVASLLAMTCFDFETSSRGDPARSEFNVRLGNLPRRMRTSIAALWLYPLKNSRSI